jgi:hypothetical protein
LSGLIAHTSNGRIDVLDPWKFFPACKNVFVYCVEIVALTPIRVDVSNNISLSLDEYHLEESMDDLKLDDGLFYIILLSLLFSALEKTTTTTGEGDSEQLHHLLVDVMLDQLCEELARVG